ncbi:MAG: Arm DNA-binding domain-containing protein [bacterium]|nr:Arm DNA-binding domain-containing protein [bacterium]
MPLTDAQIRQLQPKEKPYKVFDGGGLYIEVFPDGAKRWRYKYRIAGKEKRLALGVYPETSLKKVRIMHQDARSALAKGIDPVEVKRTLAAAVTGEHSFQSVALEWVALKTPGWSESHRNKTLEILKRDLIPFLGALHIGEIKPAELLAVLKRVDQRSTSTARKAYSICKQAFIHAIPSGQILISPAEGLHAHLSPRRIKHMAAPTSRGETARLLRTIDEYHGTFVVQCALRLPRIIHFLSQTAILIY